MTYLVFQGNIFNEERTGQFIWTPKYTKDGRRVDCDYHLLKTPLKHGAYKDKILEYRNMKYGPFDKDGNGNMGYLYDLNQKLAAFFI